MAYATVEDFVEAVTAAEAAALARATPPATGYDADQLQRALDDASAEIDTYVAARYPTPLSPPPRTVQVAAIALAREILDRQGRDHVKAAAARIRGWLKDVAKGVAVLAGDQVDQAAPEPAPGGGIAYAAPDRVFDDSGLASFLRDC